MGSSMALLGGGEQVPLDSEQDWVEQPLVLPTC